MGKKREFVVVVVPFSEIKKFIAIDIVGGTVLYYILKLPFHSVFAPMIGSVVGPILIRLSLKNSRKR
jgi:hypothetical protein